MRTESRIVACSDLAEELPSREPKASVTIKIDFGLTGVAGTSRGLDQHHCNDL